MMWRQKRPFQGRGGLKGMSRKIFEKFHDHLVSPLGGSRNAGAVKQIVDNCCKYLEFINQEKGTSPVQAPF